MIKFPAVSSTVFARIWRGLTAQGYSHAVTIGLQLVSVPVLLHVWGEELYGAWLLLSVLPAYLVLSDLGFAQAATNDMTMSMARQDKDGALRTFQSLFALCLGVSGVILLITGALCLATSLPKLLNLRSVTERDAELVAFVLALQACLALVSGSLMGAIRAEGRFATMQLLNTTSRLLEGAALLAGAIAGGGLVVVAVLMLAVRAVALVITSLILRRTSSTFPLGVGRADRAELKRLVAPSLGYLAFPVGYALMIQGMLTLVGLRIPGAVALFATSRTFTRIGATILNSVNHVFLYDYGKALSGSDRRVKPLLILNGSIICGGMAVYLAAILLFGEQLYGIWTAGKLHLPHGLMLALIAAAAAEAAWAFLQTPLISINAHGKVAIGYLLASGLTLGIGALWLGRGIGLETMVWIQAMAYLGLTILIVLQLARRLRPAAAVPAGLNL